MKNVHACASRAARTRTASRGRCSCASATRRPGGPGPAELTAVLVVLVVMVYYWYQYLSAGVPEDIVSRVSGSTPREKRLEPTVRHRLALPEQPATPRTAAAVTAAVASARLSVHTQPSPNAFRNDTSAPKSANQRHAARASPSRRGPIKLTPSKVAAHTNTADGNSSDTRKRMEAHLPALPRHRPPQQRAHAHTRMPSTPSAVCCAPQLHTFSFFGAHVTFILYACLF